MDCGGAQKNKSHPGVMCPGFWVHHTGGFFMPFLMNGLNSRQEYPKRLIKIVYKSFSRTLILTMLS